MLYRNSQSTCNNCHRLNGPQNPVLVTNLAEIADSRASELPTFKYFNTICFLSSNSHSTRILNSITPGLRPTLINYLSLDFGTGVFIAPTLLNAGAKFTEQFQKTSLTIHKLFQRTLKAKVLRFTLSMCFS